MISIISCQDSLRDQFEANKDKANGAFEDAWIKQYGKVAATQTWDFSSPMPVVGPEEGVTIIPETKGMSTAAVITQPGEPNYFYPTAVEEPLEIYGLRPVLTLGELGWIKENAPLAEPKDWTPNIYGTHDMWSYYTHSAGVQTSNYLGISWFDPGEGYPKTYNPQTGEYEPYYDDGPCGTIHVTPLFVYATCGNSNGAWYGGTAYNGKGPGRRLVTAGMTEVDDINWMAYKGTDSYYDDETSRALSIQKYIELETPTGAKYWGFDCNHDGDCTNLVVLVEPSAKQTKTVRYMVEDLGSVGDFDFNDIVVDVTAERTFSNDWDENGNAVPVYGEWKAYAVVRAMGGTLDFVLKIGDTTFHKGDDFDPVTMYNTSDINWNAELAKFDVTGWDYDAHNISVSVVTGESGSVRTITFPKEGTIPMIIAFDNTQNWMRESVSIPSDWFTEE